MPIDPMQRRISASGGGGIVNDHGEECEQYRKLIEKYSTVIEITNVKGKNESSNKRINYRLGKD